MGRDALGVVSGLAVLLTGVVAVVNLMGTADEPPVETLSPPAAVVEVPATAAAAMPPQELAGIGSSTARVLKWSGSALLADDEDLAQLPPSVTALLIEYGAPLLVPTDSGETQ